MKDGLKACPHCGSRFTFEAYELVDSMPADAPCNGCLQLYAILAESARRKAEMKLQEKPEPMDLSPAAILERIRPKPPAPFDHAMAAANDRE